MGLLLQNYDKLFMFIKNIKASNFSGIKDPIEIDFSEGGKIEKDGYLNYKDERVSLVNGFYGANASGKTTILSVIDKVIEIMFKIVPEFSFTPNGLKQENIICYQNYGADMEDKPTVLEMGFVINESEYQYKILITNGKNIISEFLSKDGNVVFNRKDNKIDFEKKYKDLSSIFENYTISPRTSFVAQLINSGLSPKVIEDIILDIKSIGQKICIITDKRTVNYQQNNITGVLNVIVAYLNDPNIDKKRFLKNINVMSNFFEPTLERVVINLKAKTLNGQEIEAGFKYQNSSKLLPLMEASAGTRELISYINDLFKILKNGGVVVYDETSKYYRPDMEISILSLFKDKDVNKNNAQIFFSSHNPETFDLLHINQAYIVEKDRDIIVVNRASDFDVQERDNIKRKYRLGSLGGVPDTIDFKRLVNNLL